MEIRHTEPADLPAIKEIYDCARAFMRSRGNLTQWNNGYPSRAVIEDDMQKGHSYVLVNDGKVVGTFAFIIGEDPTYGVIEDGAWHADRTYGTIHRLASDGSVRGLAGICFDYCRTRMDYLRVDTHADNRPMQEAVMRYGFQRCGIIYVADGSPRIAYDWLKNES